MSLVMGKRRREEGNASSSDEACGRHGGRPRDFQRGRGRPWLYTSEEEIEAAATLYREKQKACMQRLRSQRRASREVSNRSRHFHSGANLESQIYFQIWKKAIWKNEIRKKVSPLLVRTQAENKLLRSNNILWSKTFI